MQPKLSIAAALVTAALALAACGTPSASHVVGSTGSGSGAGTGGTASTTTSPSGAANDGSSASSIDNTLGTATLAQVEAELSQLDGSLAQANTDLNNPQGDS